jgi:hypothetical protein
VEVRHLIRRISHENPLWGAPRIHGELLKLGYELSEATVAKYMLKGSRPPSQTWRTFIRNHLSEYVEGDQRRAGDHLTQVTVAKRLRRKSNWFDPT